MLANTTNDCTHPPLKSFSVSCVTGWYATTKVLCYKSDWPTNNQKHDLHELTNVPKISTTPSCPNWPWTSYPLRPCLKLHHLPSPTLPRLSAQVTGFPNCEIWINLVLQRGVFPECVAKDSRFTFGDLRVETCSRDPASGVRNSPQPFAHSYRGGKVAVSMGKPQKRVSPMS